VFCLPKSLHDVTQLSFSLQQLSVRAVLAAHQVGEEDDHQ
jgi:hypothetical protein